MGLLAQTCAGRQSTPLSSVTSIATHWKKKDWTLVVEPKVLKNQIKKNKNFIEIINNSAYYFHSKLHRSKTGPKGALTFILAAQIFKAITFCAPLNIPKQ